METTLRDILEAAFDEVESSPEVTVTETEVETKSERHRDESGRFASKEAKASEQPEVKPEVSNEIQPEPVVEKKAVPRPSSWKKDYEQDWETLPERIREYINEREGQYAKGVSTYKNEWDRAAPIVQAMAPFADDLRRANIDPSTWISNLGNAHRMLAMGSPEQKVEMFARLANDYGVNLGALTGQQGFDPQFSQMAQELNSIKNQWNMFQSQQQQAEQMRLQNEIAEFSATAPHLEEVRGTMAQLLQSGVATDLKSAYDKAIRLHDDIWQKQQAEQAKSVEADRMKHVAEKKAKAVSPKSSSPTGAMSQGSGKKGIREALEESFGSMSNLV